MLYEYYSDYFLNMFLNNFLISLFLLKYKNKNLLKY
jgi:hypothetical protein